MKMNLRQLVARQIYFLPLLIGIAAGLSPNVTHAAQSVSNVVSEAMMGINLDVLGKIAAGKNFSMPQANGMLIENAARNLIPYTVVDKACSLASELVRYDTQGASESVLATHALRLSQAIAHAWTQHAAHVSHCFNQFVQDRSRLNMLRTCKAIVGLGTVASTSTAVYATIIPAALSAVGLD